MSALGEKVLIQHLADRESLLVLAREGMASVVLPTEALRDVYETAIEYFHEGGRIIAPSVEWFRERFGNVLDDHEIDITYEPEDTIEWAISDLKGDYSYRETAGFTKRLAVAIAEASPEAKTKIVDEHATELVRLSLALERSDTRADLRTAMADRMYAYDERAANRDTPRGMRLGFPEIDAYTHGIHPGELAVIAGPPKAGKSYALAWAALSDWQAGGRPMVFSLELSVEMMLDRIACLHLHLNPVLWERGLVTPEVVTLVRRWQREVAEAPNPLMVMQPDLGKRSIEHMVRVAQVEGSTSLIIDQLSFVELPSVRKPKNERVGEALHTLVGMIGSGRDRLPCLVASQINREGQKAAEKVGHLEMYHMADAAEIERTASWVCGLYQTKDHRAVRRMLFQILAARRQDLCAWDLDWRLDEGAFRVRQEVPVR